MRSPFLIARLVTFALLTYFSLLVLVFAAWNIAATKAIQQPVPGSAALLVFDSCLLFVFIALSFIEFAFKKFKLAIVGFEIGWVCMLSMFEVGASISLVANGPVMTCQFSSEWGICASSYLLIPTVWLKSFTLLGYFFLLLISVLSHGRDLPTIWITSIYAVPWFNPNCIEYVGQPGTKELLDPDNDTWTRYLANIASSADTDCEKAEKTHWSQSIDIKRGIDSPFMLRDDERLSAVSSFQNRPQRPPRPPTQALSIGSRFVERFRDSRVLSRPPAPPPVPAMRSHFSIDTESTGLGRQTMMSFATDVADHDKPIPLPRHSQWLRADLTKSTVSRAATVAH
ncbi:hypothetical protein CYLTODRAFT_493277 [Cylindrobasidium torrendii FP15055 ss-10]|uniref:Transmembrane protein n=1 Tax=Cylindrobasidium torrendii FP15055 ss-10 TaxID=1314674 RepID=A0A0D7B258_9AGAR|nr:hypothetical protein CYLTODRAFT_493277 [Cylindrobasidium torrendii FP15055 ss-10]